MEFDVSVCIPVFNNLNTLKRCVDSVLDQSFSNYEIIITDDSTNIDIQEYIKSLNNSRIRYFKNQVRLGSPENWNEAIRNSSAKLIKLMHHDDYFAHKESLQVFYDLMLDDQVSIGFVSSINYELASKQVISMNNPSFHEVESINSNPFRLLNANYIGAPSAMIFRKRDILFDKNLIWLVDIDFYITMLKDGSKIKYYRSPEVIIGISENQITKLVQDDKAVNIFEYFYILQKNKINKVYSNLYSKPTIDLIEKFSVKSIDQIVHYYSGELPLDLYRYFTIKYRFKKWVRIKFSLMRNLFLKK